MKTALILCGIDPGLGGVLLRGEKGTAKSTAARGLASLLPPIKAVAGCPWHCDPEGPLCPRCASQPSPLPVATMATPFVDLPLSAGEEQVAGSLDLNAAVGQGRLKLRPGLLARAHRGVLYIDEVNLLPAHISQMILDAAASGWAVVEREGISRRHPARFSLIASCNPEEGPLGPQLSDRFGLCVTVRGESDPEQRREVLRRRLAYEADPAGFASQWADEQAALATRLAAARETLAQVVLTSQARDRAANLATDAGCQGQRAELAMARAARALAAWRGLDQAGPELVREIAPLALEHRARMHEEQPMVTVTRVLEASSDQSASAPPSAGAEEQKAAMTPGSAGGDTMEQVLRVFQPAAVKPVATRTRGREGGSLNQAGRRDSRQTSGNRGRYLRSSEHITGRRGLAFDATFRAAAPHQKERRTPQGPALVIRRPDLREKVRASRRGRLLLFLVDSSGSMNAAARMRETKAAVLGLLMEAYQKRDRVGLVAAGGQEARVLLPPTSSVEVARRLLAELPTGGKTPLAHGMMLISEILARELAQDPKLNPLVVILTDGRPNVPLDKEAAERRVSVQGGWTDAGYADREVLELARAMAADPRCRYVVVDTDTGHYHEINLCRPLAQYLGAPCSSLGKVNAEQVLDLVKAHW